MPRIDWTPEQDDLLRSWASEVPPVSLGKQAKRLGVSHGSVANRRKHLGITSDHAGTKAANEARRVDAAARRVALEHRHLDRIEHLMDRLEAPTWQTILRGEMGTEEQCALEFVPPRDEKDIAATLTQHWGALERIRRMDTNNGTAEAVSMLGGIAQAIANAAAGMPEDGPEA